LPACANNALLGESQSIKMQSLNSGDENVLSNDSLERDLCDLIHKGDILAIRTTDENFPYYIMKSTTCKSKLLTHFSALLLIYEGVRAAILFVFVFIPPVVPEGFLSFFFQI